MHDSIINVRHVKVMSLMTISAIITIEADLESKAVDV